MYCADINRISAIFSKKLFARFVVGTTALFFVRLLVTRIQFDRKNEYQSESIPRIFHQTWDSETIPKQFMPWIRSWTQHHPQWQYWFWTPDDVRCLLRQRYPDFLHLYDKYPTMLQRADVMRYFVLYTFGGVYADLDMQCLKPIDPLLFNRSCVFSEEPYEHVYILNRRVGDANVMNGIMACRPGHPFFKELMAKLKLPQTKNTNIRDAVATTGPFFVDSVLKQYQGNLSMYRPRKDVVTVIPPQYLLPTFDPGQVSSLKIACSKRFHASQLFTTVCNNLDRRRYENKPSELSYANHHWLHVVLLKPSWKTTNVIDIRDVISESRHRETQSSYVVPSSNRSCFTPLVKMGPALYEYRTNTAKSKIKR